MATKDLNADQVHEMYEQACDMRNALHAYEMLHPDPTVRETLNKFDTFLFDHDLID